MLSMVKNEHASSPVTAEPYRPYTDVQPREAIQRDIPIPVLVKHEEYTANNGNEHSDSSSQDAGKRSREKRSTKSKCPPGLRSGKWTAEEEAFTNMIIYYFKRGLLNIEDGTSLRWYLAKRLNCEAMRVTKKLKGNSSIGKQIFRALENTEENRRDIDHAADELAVLERAFLDSLSSPIFGVKDLHKDGPVNPQAVAAAAALARARKASPHEPLSVSKPSSHEPKQLNIPTQPGATFVNSEDANLLLHFFVGAHGAVDSPSSEKKRLKNDVDSPSPKRARSSLSSDPTDSA
ncbi:hypothetical protein Poli38472_008872 [Pythium oligandrum]|uniref:Uncharacterized protein n=1 Tax=Pythium oligandrum TaxID=41045 RepID=A0A8K1C4C8_PYTOL|nr:hypothetical protein Poli38472_008872 [Pythium oligandrum]|eukprot:TMW56224.1 hypothetical protein Poli38472_008872 [Pythium oligandrum]